MRSLALALSIVITTSATSAVADIAIVTDLTCPANEMIVHVWDMRTITPQGIVLSPKPICLAAGAYPYLVLIEGKLFPFKERAEAEELATSIARSIKG